MRSSPAVRRPAEGAVPRHIEEEYRRRINELPDATRRLTLLAAADPTGDATLVWRAARTLDVGHEAADAAEGAQLLEIGSACALPPPARAVRGLHGWVAEDRRAAHLALAEATDREVDPDRRAWHLGMPPAGPTRPRRPSSSEPRSGLRPAPGCRPPRHSSSVRSRLTPEPATARRSRVGCGLRQAARRCVRRRARAARAGRRPTPSTTCSSPARSSSGDRSTGRRAPGREAPAGAAPRGEAARAVGRRARQGDLSPRVGRLDDGRPAAHAWRPPARRLPGRAIGRSSGPGSAVRRLARRSDRLDPRWPRGGRAGPSTRGGHLRQGGGGRRRLAAVGHARPGRVDSALGHRRLPGVEQPPGRGHAGVGCALLVVDRPWRAAARSSRGAATSRPRRRSRLSGTRSTR